jgi:hypothetical protein
MRCSRSPNLAVRPRIFCGGETHLCPDTATGKLGIELRDSRLHERPMSGGQANVGYPVEINALHRHGNDWFRRTAVSASPDRELPLTTQTEPSAAGFWRGVPWRCWAPGACAPPRPIPSGPPPPPADGRVWGSAQAFPAPAVRRRVECAAAGAVWERRTGRTPPRCPGLHQLTGDRLRFGL